MNQQLIELRRNLGLTQAKLAELSGVAESTISRLERGTGTARLDTRQLLCKALRWPQEKHLDLFGPIPQTGPKQANPKAA